MTLAASGYKFPVSEETMRETWELGEEFEMALRDEAEHEAELNLRADELRDLVVADLDRLAETAEDFT